MERKAIRIYWFASFLAVIEALVLFILGLELRLEQAQIFLLFGFPAPLIMLLCDHWLIIRHVRPIDAVLRAQTSGHSVTPDEGRRAYLQTLNLPILTLLRVLTIHAPSVLIPLTLLSLLANQVADLGLAWWQFFVLWSFWPITAVPHAIVEAFLIDRAGRHVLKRLEWLNPAPITVAAPRASFAAVLRLLLGLQLTTPHLVRTSTGVQLSWFVFFVSLMPMVTLGASVYLKIAAFNTEATRAQLLGAVGPWIILLILLNAVISIVIVTLMSRRVRGCMQELLGKMQRILQGDLSQHWSPHTTDEFFDLGAGFNAMLLGLRERETIKDTFGRFVSPEVATAVLEGRVPLRGEVREVTILFQDVRDFTSLSERTPPAVLLQLLNTLYTEMVAAVETYGGIVKQFTGDGVMALFGAPVRHAQDPVRAVHSALAMLTRLEALNGRRRAHGDIALRIGIGIHTGEVVAGCIGPDTRLEYSVVGDAVNVASRVQELTKEVGAAILVTQSTAVRLEARFTFGKQAVLPVRGKTEPIRVIEILGERAP